VDALGSQKRRVRSHEPVMRESAKKQVQYRCGDIEEGYRLALREYVIVEMESLCVPRLRIFSVPRSSLYDTTQRAKTDDIEESTHSRTEVSRPPLYACEASEENAHARTAARWSNFALASPLETPSSPIS
jgi:hypothetical protein